MAERSFAEFLAALEQTAAQDDEDERSLLQAVPTKAVTGIARTVVDARPKTPAATSRPKFCRQCGTEIQPQWRFCTKCGAPIVTATVTDSTNAGVPTAS
mgnify:CR=1 FL=1